MWWWQQNIWGEQFTALKKASASEDKYKNIFLVCVSSFFSTLLSWSVELLMFLSFYLSLGLAFPVFWSNFKFWFLCFEHLCWFHSSHCLLKLIQLCDIVTILGFFFVFWCCCFVFPFTAVYFPECILCFTWSFWFFFFVLTLSLHFAFYLQRIDVFGFLTLQKWHSAGLIKAQGSVWCHGWLTSPIHNFKITIEIQLKSALS